MRPFSARCRGSLLIDAAMATAVLGVAMVVTLQVLDRIAAQRRAADRRQLATQWVANALEQIGTRTWEELAPGSIAAPTLDASIQKLLPGARASAATTDDSTAGVMRRVVVELSWVDRSGAPPSSVRLVTWIARAGRDRP